ncbi:uncharacterized protein C3orf22 homolog isoform X2 [Hyaena hyaena]|nr:uncharacterized protein C3orf22 homolog isoform X2 [Hyaena hyaena]XP_039074468.1 uncharacterized protein C3orf22 homolog isoform X2 [Hyaena hyaena]
MAEECAAVKPPSTMTNKDPKKGSQYKKSKTKILENFIRKFPHRLSGLTGPSAQFPEPREAAKTDASLRARPPLQKVLVPTRSIPVRGLGAPDFVPLSSPRRRRPPPLNYLWELKLLSHRFPGLASGAPHLQRPLLEPRSVPRPPPRPPAPAALGSAAAAEHSLLDRGGPA